MKSMPTLKVIHNPMGLTTEEAMIYRAQMTLGRRLMRMWKEHYPSQYSYLLKSRQLQRTLQLRQKELHQLKDKINEQMVDLYPAKSQDFMDQYRQATWADMISEEILNHLIQQQEDPSDSFPNPMEMMRQHLSALIAQVTEAEDAQ
ncbi:hypothetical protein [Marinobacterium sp. BA1]|uniref:hypothetical protein n=1 Tax=Marinobacterium sp. BA1 TaxID=3138931 RepID=UPI0032E73576